DDDQNFVGPQCTHLPDLHARTRCVWVRSATVSDIHPTRNVNAQKEIRPGPVSQPGPPPAHRADCNSLLVHVPVRHRGRRGLLLRGGVSLLSASVVSSSEAIDAAFCNATRSTLAGSMMPACSMSTYSMLSAS